jgi:tRNA-2-methylthio-N6-dimethylallyladenosine synthase
MNTHQKVLVKTFGCQMNVYDSERMVELLAPLGYSQTESLEDADVVILNTCHIREKAAEKTYSDLGRVGQIKRRRREGGKETVVAVTGCVAQAEGAEVLRREACVDLVVGPQSYHKLGDAIRQARSTGRRVVETDFPAYAKFSALGKRTGPKTATAFLTVQEGCDKFCAFCVVPYTRGAEFSRPVEEVDAEARRLVDIGVREITLLGQNVNSYHGEGFDGRPWSLARLISRLSCIDGLERLRYTTSHPHDMTDDLIAAHGSQAKLMPFLHLPVQAGSDRVLAAMNRKHTRDDYLSLVERIRSARPDIALSTDIIVGFPGETERDFEDTLDMLEQVRFSQAYSFKYSPRPGTPAAGMVQLPDAVKAERLQQVQEVVAGHQISFNHRCVGLKLPVLFDRLGRLPGQLAGRSPYLQAVHAWGDESLIGRSMEVEIHGAGPNSLSGSIVGGAS